MSLTAAAALTQALAAVHERHREVHAIEQRAGIDPRVCGHRVPGRRLAAVERHPELLHRLHQRLRVHDGRARSSNGRDDELERGLHLGAIRLSREELRRGDDDARHFAQVALRVEKLLRRAVDERLGRLIGDEALRQLEGDVARGVRVLRQHVQDAFALFLAAAFREIRAEDHLLARVVHLGTEQEAAAHARLIDRPARERARDLDDVLLGVAAVDAERVQLHQLTRVVFVEPSLRALLRLARLEPLHELASLLGPQTGIVQPALHLRADDDRGVRRGALKVVEVEQHRRAVRGRAEQIAEAAEHMRADDVLLVVGQVLTHLTLSDEHVEVVEPEIDEDFLQLPLGHRGAE